MIDYTRGLVIGHNTMSQLLSLTDIHLSIRTHAYAPMLVEQLTFLPAVMTSSSSVDVVMYCQGSVAAQQLRMRELTAFSKLRTID